MALLGVNIDHIATLRHALNYENLLPVKKIAKVKQANWPCYGQANCAAAKYPDRNPGPRRTGLEPRPTLKGVPTIIPGLKTGIYVGFHIKEYNSGHSIMAHAVLVGWERAIREMKALVS